MLKEAISVSDIAAPNSGANSAWLFIPLYQGVIFLHDCHSLNIC